MDESTDLERLLRGLRDTLPDMERDYGFTPTIEACLESVRALVEENERLHTEIESHPAKTS